MIVCSVTVGASDLPSVFVAKSPCEGCEEAVAAAAAGAGLSAVAASENLLVKIPVQGDNKVLQMLKKIAGTTAATDRPWDVATALKALEITLRPILRIWASSCLSPNPFTQ